MPDLSAPSTAPPAHFPRFLRIFEPEPAAPVKLTDPAEIKAQYHYWQRRMLVWSIVGYALFYFVRKNLSIAMPAMGKELGISKADLGLFLTLHGLLYGVSKFAHGFFGDRANARTLMATGLLLSAVMNVLVLVSARPLWISASFGCSTAGCKGWVSRPARGS